MRRAVKFEERVRGAAAQCSAGCDWSLNITVQYYVRSFFDCQRNIISHNLIISQKSGIGIWRFGLCNLNTVECIRITLSLHYSYTIENCHFQSSWQGHNLRKRDLHICAQWNKIKVLDHKVSKIVYSNSWKLHSKFVVPRSPIVTRYFMDLKL